jgi:heat shock protein HtpX
MLRIALFLGTNLAVLLVISVVFRLLGLEGFLTENGLDLGALLLFSALIGFLGSIISLLISKPMAKASMRVRTISPADGPTERWLCETVADQAQRAGIKTPEVGIFASQAPNAFATGWNKDAALVAVSEGLLSAMNRREVEAVLAHEVSHVANGDMVTLALIQGVVNTFVVFLSRVVGYLVDRTVFRTEQGAGPGFWIASIASEILFGFLATMIVMWFSRVREYRADKGGAELAGRDAMIAALDKLRGFSKVADKDVPDELRAFAISAGKMHALFASHPPLEDRIKALAAGGATSPWERGARERRAY